MDNAWALAKHRRSHHLVTLLTVAVSIYVIFISGINMPNEWIQSALETTECNEKNTNVSVRNYWNFSSSRSTFRDPCETCRKRLPGAIIAGVQKCGTGALMVFLNLHPEIAGAVNSDVSAGNQATELKFFTVMYKKGLEWYRNKMPCSFSNQITVEKDPPYFYRAYCAQRIREMDAAAKIIFIVKEPIERALSMHAMYVAEGNTKRSFEETITDQNGDIKYDHIILMFSSYINYIAPWIDQFGLEQIHFVDGNKFEQAPDSELKRVETFLKIKPYFDENMFWLNKTKGKKCFYSADSQPLCLDNKKGRTHQEIPESLQLKLQQHFKPLNERFFRKINRTFPWRY